MRKIARTYTRLISHCNFNLERVPNDEKIRHDFYRFNDLSI